MNVIFQTPVWLWLLPLTLAFLVYIYLRKGFGKEQKVASVFLLKQIKSSSNTRKKFIPPWIFFLELLLFALIILNLAGININSKTGNNIIIIDNSFSLMAKPGLPYTGKLIDLAKEQAKNIIKENPNFNANWKIFVTAPELKANSAEYIKAQSAISYIEQIDSVYSDQKLNLLNYKLGSFDELYIISDQNYTSDLNLPAKLNLTNVKDKKSLQNVFISEVNNKIVKIKAATQKKVAVRLELNSYQDKLNPRSIKTSLLIIEPNTSQVVELDPKLADFMPVQVKISLEGSENKNLDCIEEDNLAWLNHDQDIASTKIVSELSKQDLGLENIPVTLITPEEFSEMTNISGKNFIFHLLSLNILPKANAAFILPASSSNFKVKDIDNNERIIYWDETHEILKYINFKKFNPKILQIFEKQYWQENLLTSKSGSSLLAGTLDSYKYALIGFDIFPLTQSKRSESIFLLNLIKWLADNEINQFKPYKKIKFVSESMIEFFDGTRFNKIDPTTNEIKIPGIIYQNSQPYQAINFISATESETLQAQPQQLEISELKNVDQYQSSLKYLLLALSLILLIIHIYLIL